MSEGIDEALEEAWELSRQGRFAEAMAICDRVIAERPHDYAGYYRKANVLMMMGDYDSAARQLDRVVEVRPDEAFAYQVRGEELYKAGRCESALADFERSDALDRGFFGHDIKICKAACLMALGRLEEAEAVCRDVPDDHECLGFHDHPKATKRIVLGRAGR